VEINNQTTYYTTEEISKKLGINYKSVLNKISKLGLKKHKTIGPKGNALYTKEQYALLCGKKLIPNLLHNYNKKPVIVTYYIYESKMNNPENKL